VPSCDAASGSWIVAGLWGLLGGGALLLGAGMGYLAAVPRRVLAGVMAFGAGVLVSALSFDLMDEAFEKGGLAPTAIGFVAGAVVYSGANAVLSRMGAKHRKRSGEKQVSEAEHAGSGTAIALGALLDGIPESIVIGLSLLRGSGVSVAVVAAVFLSNIPEGLSSSAGMKAAGRSPGFIFGMWSVIALVSGAASVVGYTQFCGVPDEVVAATIASAAGAILAMLADTMIPEAFEGTHELAGLVTVIGFLAAFALTKLSP
jgi:ZIP family zinc transporter